ncbi:hypothetical protein KAU11_07410 [Candidatus Babeliales bacterium]|nr:hypothetical protein [Candidatus Babeliales bacterium]
MKKAQIQSQIFVYVLAMIIIGAILLYGYKSINMMRDKGEQIDLLSFKTDIEQEISKMSADYGSARHLTLKIPHGFEEVCFIDLTKNPLTEIQRLHPLVYESWADKTANIFLIKDLAEEFQLVQEGENYLIEIDNPGFLCIPIKNNRITIRLEGLGGKARLSQIE